MSRVTLSCIQHRSRITICGPLPGHAPRTTISRGFIRTTLQRPDQMCSQIHLCMSLYSMMPDTGILNSLRYGAKTLQATHHGIINERPLN